MSDSLSEHAAQALEWPRLLEILARHAQSSMGIAQCRSLAMSKAEQMVEVFALVVTEANDDGPKLLAGQVIN